MLEEDSPSILVIGLFLVYLALFLIGWVAFKTSSGIPLSRRRPDAMVHASGLTRLTEHAVGALNKSVRERGNRFLSRDRLDECGLKKDPGDYLLMAGVATLLAAVFGFFLGGLVPAILLSLVSPLIFHLVLNMLAARRRRQFDEQVPDTLQMLAGGLRAGHSLLRAVDAAAQESQPPMAEELSRIVNETRIGRDLGESLAEVARRTESEDFMAIAQAIEIHREVGGDLAEVLDHLGDTVRDRNQVRGQIRALSAEGRMSAIVLMALPVVMFIGLTLFNDLYSRVFLTTVSGFVLIAVAIVLLTVGGLWLRQLVKPKF
ncbi:type II secretion system F family protein [Pseudarthrobacter sp. HLT3-5]|uniref:type II secretion system F family protein n=1 Tax=Pseudarthrobacter cellobiosi TaxID=2953654 RepID=UPI00208E3B9A|nr:type II secretion system F family protein [Pseudarthrobacter sp. HLT3-5]MCO4275099.1 type II secretion system F family protein [Pseudarthrobacter sp. HLT3-5]